MAILKANSYIKDNKMNGIAKQYYKNGKLWNEISCINNEIYRIVK